MPALNRPILPMAVITEKLVETLHKGGKFSPSMLFNTFENIAFDDYNMRKVYVEHLIKLGAPHVHLAGSGPALFTMFQDKEKARESIHAL